MDKHLRQQSHPEPLNRSLVLLVTFITTPLTYHSSVRTPEGKGKEL